jgi:hypothetical protein
MLALLLDAKRAGHLSAVKPSLDSREMISAGVLAHRAGPRSWRRSWGPPACARVRGREASRAIFLPVQVYMPAPNLRLLLAAVCLSDERT